MEPEPVTVWVVRPPETEPSEVRMEIQEATLVLGSDRVPLSGVAITPSARSPVLELRWPGRTVLVYFVRPPDLSAGPFGGLSRTAALLGLRAAGRDLRSLVLRWGEALARASGAES